MLGLKLIRVSKRGLWCLERNMRCDAKLCHDMMRSMISWQMVGLIWNVNLEKYRHNWQVFLRYQFSVSTNLNSTVYCKLSRWESSNYRLPCCDMKWLVTNNYNHDGGGHCNVTSHRNMTVMGTKNVHGCHYGHHGDIPWTFLVIVYAVKLVLCPEKILEMRKELKFNTTMMFWTKLNFELNYWLVRSFWKLSFRSILTFAYCTHSPLRI